MSGLVRHIDLSQSLPNQVNDFNMTTRFFNAQEKACRNPFQTRSTTSIFAGGEWEDRYRAKSQSLPNQVNDFNQTEKTTISPPQFLSQSLPNQVNDFN